MGSLSNTAGPFYFRGCSFHFWGKATMTLQTIAVITACCTLMYGILRLVPALINMIRSVIDVASYIKQVVQQHEVMWSDYCARNPGAQAARTNGRALETH